MPAFLAVLWRMIEPFLYALGVRVSKNLLDVALKYVQEVHTNPNLTNAEKHDYVAYQLQQENWETGSKPGDLAINLAIEFAVAHLKKHGPAPAAQPAS